MIQGSPANPFSGVRWIWMNGGLVEFEKATVHVLTHALHYGSGLFEGIRCYDTAAGSAVLRLPEHLRGWRTPARSTAWRSPTAASS